MGTQARRLHELAGHAAVDDGLQGRVALRLICGAMSVDDAVHYVRHGGGGSFGYERGGENGGGGSGGGGGGGGGNSS